jgi:hypothetical protein
LILEAPGNQADVVVNHADCSVKGELIGQGSVQQTSVAVVIAEVDDVSRPWDYFE